MVIPRSTIGLFLDINSGVIPGRLGKPYEMPGIEVGFGYLQGKHPTSTIALALMIQVLQSKSRTRSKVKDTISSAKIPSSGLVVDAEMNLSELLNKELLNKTCSTYV